MAPNRRPASPLNTTTTNLHRCETVTPLTKTAEAAARPRRYWGMLCHTRTRNCIFFYSADGGCRRRRGPKKLSETISHSPYRPPIRSLSAPSDTQAKTDYPLFTLFAVCMCVDGCVCVGMRSKRIRYVLCFIRCTQLKC